MRTKKAQLISALAAASTCILNVAHAQDNKVVAGQSGHVTLYCFSEGYADCHIDFDYTDPYNSADRFGFTIKEGKTADSYLIRSVVPKQEQDANGLPKRGVPGSNKNRHDYQSYTLNFLYKDGSHTNHTPLYCNMPSRHYCFSSYSFDKRYVELDNATHAVIGWRRSNSSGERTTVSLGTALPQLLATMKRRNSATAHLKPPAPQ